MSQTQSDTFPLEIPFTTPAGVRVENIVLNRLTVKDLKNARKVSKDPLDWDDLLLSRSTGMLPEDLDSMDLADYMGLQARFQKITGVGKKSQSDDAGSGATGEVVPVSAGGD